MADGLLYFRQRLWLGGSTTLQQTIYCDFHDSRVSNHSGFPVTYRRLRRLFAWPKMKHTIKEYVQSCPLCQQAKPERVKYPGLLKPLPIPEGARQVVMMDFIDGLPQSRRANCILVVMKFHALCAFSTSPPPFHSNQGGSILSG